MNDGYKHSFFIAIRNALLLTEAFVVSYCLNRPLNRHVTIHWGQAGVSRKAQKQLTRFLKLAGDWLRMRGVQRRGVSLPPFYAWVFENPVEAGDNPKGLHSHIAIHVPDEDWEEFCPMVPNWLELMLGEKPARQVWDCKVCFNWGDDDFYWNGLAGLLYYFLKGIEPRLAKAWGVKEESLKPQGEVIGKRCGRSESLNPAKITWISFSFVRWPGVVIAGPELRNLHLLRYAIPHALPDEPSASRSVTVPAAMKCQRTGQGIPGGG